MSGGLADRVAALTAQAVTEARPVGGGCIGESHALRLADGTRLFAKDYAAGPHGMASAEARGLAWLAEASALPVARVHAHSDAAGILLLEWIEGAPPRADFAERLGHGLALLHRHGAPQRAPDEGAARFDSRSHSAPAPRFGFEEDNFIGTLQQDNTPAADWPAFYANRRLLPLVRCACEAGVLPPAHARRAEALCARLPGLCGPAETPARLHGDLWSGNVMTDAEGGPIVIDPAVYRGHREIDLAMMHLFGGFPRRVFDAYAEAFPLAHGADERVLLHQLYPLLVHVVLFGGHYVESFDAGVRRYL